MNPVIAGSTSVTAKISAVTLATTRSTSRAAHSGQVQAAGWWTQRHCEGSTDFSDRIVRKSSTLTYCDVYSAVFPTQVEGKRVFA